MNTLAEFAVLLVVLGLTVLFGFRGLIGLACAGFVIFCVAQMVAG